MVQNRDLLCELDKEGIRTVAFKAEMDPETAAANAAALIGAKGVDAVCLNLLKGSESFGTDDNQIDLITASGSVALPRADKMTLALQLLKHAEGL